MFRGRVKRMPAVDCLEQLCVRVRIRGAQASVGEIRSCRLPASMIDRVV
jgi:hypothetical protein